MSCFILLLNKLSLQQNTLIYQWYQKGVVSFYGGEIIFENGPSEDNNYGVELFPGDRRGGRLINS